MELLEGESLYERFRERGPLPWRRDGRRSRARVCSSLAEAHALGIVHRDLKPANIHLETRGGERTSSRCSTSASRRSSTAATLDDSELTHAGQMIGTFDYMPPEQMVGGECTGQSDIFTLGIVMYEMITGERPFGAPPSAAGDARGDARQDAAPMPSSRPVPAELDRIVAALPRAQARRIATRPSRRSRRSSTRWSARRPPATSARASTPSSTRCSTTH